MASTLRYLIISIFLFSACDNKIKESQKLKRTPNPILTTKVLSWDQLNIIQRDRISAHNFIHPDGYDKGPVEFEREKAFYVVATVDIKSLAKLSESDAFKADKILENNNPYAIYGRDKNTWRFTNSGLIIHTTDKFQGFHIEHLSRNRSKDSVLIGPIPEKPEVMIIKYLGDGKIKSDTVSLVQK